MFVSLGKGLLRRRSNTIDVAKVIKRDRFGVFTKLS